MRRKLIDFEPLQVPVVDLWVGENASDFFVYKHGRKLNSLNPRYMLPVDDDEIRVCLC